jgi:cytochrome c-type biogenesis protein CcmH
MCITLFGLVWGGQALAVSDPREMLHDRTLELRAEAIGAQLRCVVCQNESIEASGADMARDLRHIVREQVAAGATDRQVLDWMVARYGDFIRLRPPFDRMTAFLWFAPIIALAFGFTLLLVIFRRRGPLPGVPLTEDEYKRLIKLVGSSTDPNELTTPEGWR